MATESIPAMLPSDDLQSSPGSSGNLPSPPTPQAENREKMPVGLWVKRIGIVGLLVAVAVAGTQLVLSDGKGQASGPRLTHVIKRGNLDVSVTEQGTLESSENTELKCKVRGNNTVTWVIEGGTFVEKDDVLVELDTLAIEEAISERTKYALWSKSGALSWETNVEKAKLAIEEYKNGRFVVEKKAIEKSISLADENLSIANNQLRHTQMMADKGYVSNLQVAQKTFQVTQAKMNLEILKTQLDVLTEFTFKEEMEQLNGTLKVAQAQFSASDERANADASRRDRALEELELCVIKAPRSGMVIHPSSAAWETAPEISEGATVHKEQVLMLMPDMSSMQVKVGIHESMVDRVSPGVKARVRLPDRALDAEVSEVASVTSPAGWWTGNVVKYDTIVQLPNVPELKPGMSAEVEVILAEHKDVLLIPVAAVVETKEGSLCWVSTPKGEERRLIELGDTDDVFVIIKEGLKEGDEVILNPLAFVEEAQEEVLKPLEDTEPELEEADESQASRQPKPQQGEMPVTSKEE